MEANNHTMLRKRPPAFDDILPVSLQDHFRQQELPLARIKKIMKLDEDVKVLCLDIVVNLLNHRIHKDVIQNFK